MTEIMARISSGGRVELIDDSSAIIKSVDPMTPQDAAYLARGMLACAAALLGPNPPSAGAIGGDAHLPIMTWGVSTSTVTGAPVLILSIPSGIELTFSITPEGAKEVGAALIAQGEDSAPPEGRTGTVH
jgi:hypothetical protein